MHAIFVKTAGGLTRECYLRHFMFGLIYAVFFSYSAVTEGVSGVQLLGILSWVVVSQMLYPYARFVYERVVNYIVGENFFLVGVKLMAIVKLITMGICWVGAICIAPVGLVYLYGHHCKQQRLAQQAQAVES